MRIEPIAKLTWCLLLALLILPVVLSGVGSVLSEGELSFDAYDRALFSDRNLVLLRNSLLLAVGCSLLSTLLGVPLALIAARTNAVRWFTAASLLVIPLLIPRYLHTVAWIHLLGPGGFLAGTTSGGEANWTVRLVYGLPGAISALSLGLFPIPALCALAALIGADQRLEEEARLDAGPFRVLLFVSLPAAMPGIVTGMVLVFLMAAVDFGVADQLLYKVYPTEVFTQFSAFYNEKRAFASSLPLLAVCLLVIGTWRLWGMRWSPPEEGTPLSGSAPLRLSGRGHFLTGFLILFPIVAAVSPILGLLACTSVEAFIEAFGTASDEIVQSLTIGPISSFLCVTAALIGVMLGGFYEKCGLILGALLFILPGPVLGISLVTFWNRPGVAGMLYGTDAMLILGMIARFLFVAMVVVRIARGSVGKQLVEQAVVDGAGRVRTFVSVILPLMLSGIAVAFVLCMTLILGELGVSVLIVPPGGTTLAVRIMTLMHYGPEPVLASSALILVLMVLLPASAVSILIYRIFRSMRTSKR